MKISACGIMMAFCVLAPSTLLTASTIDTLSSWDGSTFVYQLGEPDTATYGQTFTVIGDSVLQNFSFQLRYDSGTKDMEFQAYVMKWSGDRATGAVLYQSAVMSVPQTSIVNFTPYVFNTGSLVLQNGVTYVAFLSDSPLQDNDPNTSAFAQMGLVPPDSYAGGTFVYSNNGANFGDLTAQAWSDGSGYGDAAFTATFAAAPLPGSLQAGLMLAIAAGLFRLVSLRNDRRKSIAD